MRNIKGLGGLTKDMGEKNEGTWRQDWNDGVLDVLNSDLLIFNAVQRTFSNDIVHIFSEYGGRQISEVLLYENRCEVRILEILQRDQLSLSKAN